MDVDRMKEQALQMGATEADLQRMGLNDQEAIAREGILILRPNLPVWNLFVNCSNQWQTVISPLGRLVKTGMNWAQVEARARHMADVRALNAAETDRLWQDLNTLEFHALQAMKEVRESEQQ